MSVGDVLAWWPVLVTLAGTSYALIRRQILIREAILKLEAAVEQLAAQNEKTLLHSDEQTRALASAIDHLQDLILWLHANPGDPAKGTFGTKP